MNLRTRAARLLAAATSALLLIVSVGCGDTFRPIVNPIPTPGGDPQLSGTLTVLTSSGATTPGYAMRLNVPGDVVQSVAPIGADPGIANFDNSGLGLYIPNGAPATVTLLGITNFLTTITLQPGSDPIAAFPGASQQYVLNASPNADCPSSASLGIINRSTASLASDVCVGPSPSYAIEVGQYVFILDRTNGVYVFSTQQQALVGNPIAVGTTPVWAAASYDSNFLYVLNQGSNDISIINTTTLAVTATVPTGGNGAVRGFFDTKLLRLYVLNSGSGTLSAFDASGFSTLPVVHAPVAVGPSPTRMSVTPDGTRIYVANTSTNIITEVNTSSFVTKTLTVGSDPAAVVTDVSVARTGTKVYASTVVPGDLKNAITVIRISDDSTIINIPTVQQDTACVATATVPCLLQRPVALLGGNN